MTTIRELAQRNLLALGAAGLMAGCIGTGPSAPGTTPGNPGFEPGDNVGDDDDSVSVEGVVLRGVVRDAMGLPIVGATVTTSVGGSVETNYDGHFVFEDLEAADAVRVSFVKEGYARTQTIIDLLEGVDNTVLQTMATVDVLETFDASAGLSFSADDATVSLPANNFVDADGNAYSGEVTVEATWFDLEGNIGEGNELLATPGDFTAIDMDGNGQRLESFGMLQVNLFGENGEELNLGAEAAPIRLPVVDWGTLDLPVAGETVPAWSYDEEAGKWIEEGTFAIVEDGGELWAEFEAPHFSTWNCDQPMPEHGCVSGQLRDTQGNPRSGATVRFVGQTYISTTTARTDQGGNFCVEVKNGETGYIEFTETVNNQTATQRSEPVTIPAGQGTCTDGDTSDCVDIGVTEMELLTCVQGVVSGAQGQPMVGVAVVSPQGGQAVTGPDGSFCLTVPVFQTTDVYVVNDDQSTVMFEPKRVYAQPGLPACQSGCPNLVLLRPYPQTTCAEGSVLISSQQAASIPVEVYDANFPEVSVSTSLSEVDGSFCVEVPFGREVTVSVGEGANSCGEETFTATQVGAQCDGSAQGSECHSLPAFSCN